VKTILLTRGYETLVDDDDYEVLNNHKWQARSSRGLTYVRRAIRLPNGKRAEPSMQNVIMNPPEGMVVDHINHNPLDNRRNNLRIATPSQNNWNTRKKSGTYKGVGWVPMISKWYSRIRYRGKNRNIGNFIIEEDAARAYDKAAIVAFGEFACTNFNSKDYTESEILEMKDCIEKMCERVKSSKFKGVSWHKRDKCWYSYGLDKDHIKRHLGKFANEEEAAEAVFDFQNGQK